MNVNYVFIPLFLIGCGEEQESSSKTEENSIYCNEDPSSNLIEMTTT